MENISISVPVSRVGVSLLTTMARELAGVVGCAAPGDELLSRYEQPSESTVGRPPKRAAASAAAAPTEKKRGRPSKAAAEAAAAAESENEDDLSDLDMNGDEGENEVDELGLDVPEAKPLTLAGDVIPAFRAALDRVKGDKSKLAKVLEGYNVKSVQLLPEAKFAEVVAKLAKLK